MLELGKNMFENGDYGIVLKPMRPAINLLIKNNK